MRKIILIMVEYSALPKRTYEWLEAVKDGHRWEFDSEQIQCCKREVSLGIVIDPIPVLVDTVKILDRAWHQRRSDGS